MEYSDFPDNIKKIVSEFTKPYFSDPNVAGILIVGSYANSTPNKYSDLDIYIVLEDSEVRERGNLFIDGIEVEYFINPVDQVLHYMETESIYFPHTVHMFATGTIFYEKIGSSQLKNLVIEARKRRTATIPELSTMDIELAKYQIDDILKDAMDVYESNKISYYLISSLLVNYCVELFFKINQRIVPKSKRRHLVISKYDPKFSKILATFVDNQSVDSLQILVSHIEYLLGGKRSDTWKLSDKLTYSE